MNNSELYLSRTRDIDDQLITTMVNDNLLRLMDKTGYQIIQTNGQRVYAPPGQIENTLKGCEVFVGKIPRDMFEDELVPIFEKVGFIYQMRLMMDFTGRNRGYGFVTYYSAEIANAAVRALHGYEVRPGRHIGVYKSLDNCRLFVGGIPLDKTKDEVWTGLSQYVDGIKEVIMYQAHANKLNNRGFVFVEFEEHRLAAMARRKLSPGSLVLWGVPILVDWADPIPEVDPAHMQKISKLYMRNLDLDLKTEDLWNIIVRFVPPEYVIKAHKILDYAFIHFTTRKTAEEGLELLQGIKINGETVDVTWARPRIYSRSNRMLNPPSHFCTSLPPRMRKHIQNRREFENSSRTVSEDAASRKTSPLSSGPSVSSSPPPSGMFSQLNMNIPFPTYNSSYIYPNSRNIMSMMPRSADIGIASQPIVCSHCLALPNNGQQTSYPQDIFYPFRLQNHA